MKLENVKVGMKVKVKSTPAYGSKAYASSLGKVATVYAVDHEDSEKDVRVLCDGGGYNWLNHADIKMIDKLKIFNPKVGDSVYVTSKALDSLCPSHTVESVVTWTGNGYKCTDGYSWLRLDLGSYRKPKEGDRINSARLTLGTIKVGMKVRTLEGTLTDKFRFPIGTEFTVTSIYSDGKYATIYYKKPDGTLYKQTDSIEHLTKSW